MKMNIVVVFGGQSTEHDISRRSVVTVLDYLDDNKYEVYTVGITKEGQWLLYDGNRDAILNDTWMQYGIPAYISPDATRKALVIEHRGVLEMINIDAVIPVLHGLYGEDGSIQGLFRLAGIPYVGCGILASSVAMDKLYTKLVVEPLGIRQAKYVRALKEDYDRITMAEEVNNKLTYPVFVKPSNAGSSIGVSKAESDTELHDALVLAFEHDRKVLVEEGIDGREVECAVLGNFDVVASDVGEILAADEFYDFDSKYNSEDSETVLSADIPSETKELIRDYAVQIFKAIDGRGLSRVDFFVENGTGDVIFNEINTYPGFTNISMYPMLMAEAGYEGSALMDKLIELAIEAAEL